MKDKETELKKLQEKITKVYKKYLTPLYKEEKKLKDAIENQDFKALLGKTFIYKNNSYSCPENKSDYWDIYLKVVGLINGGIRVITVEKDSYECIMIQTEDRYGANLRGYKSCNEKDFEKHFNKLLGELKKLK